MLRSNKLILVSFSSSSPKVNHEKEVVITRNDCLEIVDWVTYSFALGNAFVGTGRVRPVPARSVPANWFPGWVPGGLVECAAHVPKNIFLHAPKNSVVLSKPS